MTSYADFIESKSQMGGKSGFKPVWMPSFLFDFQTALVEWNLEKGKAATFADCGLGKGPMALVWAENVVRKTNKPVLIVAPLAVSMQFVTEAKKFGIEVERSKTGVAAKNITITNYQSIGKFDPNDFAGVVCDESAAIKNFEGETQGAVNTFMQKTPYRLLCTATAAPNDYIELLTSAEVLGEMGRMDALGMFFKNDENSLHPIWWGARWRFKKHAEKTFWRWVCSWSRAIRKPSDLGFADGKFVLPTLTVSETVVKNKEAFRGELFPIQAETLQEQRQERKLTLDRRCEEVARKCEAHPLSVIWCHYNEEANLLEKIVPGAKQIQGSDSDDEKEETFNAFAQNEIKRLVIKPKIGCWGLNWQHCNHTTFFPSHSFEQYYQGVRRFWRFGQTKPVTVDIITTEGELGVLKNLQRKSEAADRMFSELTTFMNDALKMERQTTSTTKIKTPLWL